MLLIYYLQFHCHYFLAFIWSTNIDNSRATASFVNGLGISQVHLLSYHRFGEGKYHKPHKTYDFKAYTPDDDRIEKLLGIFDKYGVNAQKSG